MLIETLTNLESRYIVQLQSRKMSSTTIREEKYMIEKIRNYAMSYPPNSDIGDVLTAFIELYTKRKNEARTKMTKSSIGRCIKVARRLKEIHDGKPITWIYSTISKRPLNAYYTEVFMKTKAAMAEKYTDYATMSYDMRTFFIWLEKHRIERVEDITSELVQNYLSDRRKKIKSAAYGTTHRLKAILRAMHSIGLINDDYEKAFLLRIKRNTRLHCPVSPEAALAVLQKTDRSTPIGKRDYAIFLLAIVTGLRGIDIRRLTFSSIDWRRGRIHIVQSKTGRPLDLPLTKDVADAIGDYIENGRPNELANTDRIFVNNRSPYDPIGKQAIECSFRKKILDSGFGGDQTRFHGLRRLRGVSLVTSGSSLVTVMNILGHKGTEALDRYLSFDEEKLRFCALPLSLTY